MTKSGFDLDEIERLLAAATPGEWRTSAGNETEIFGEKKDVARAYCGGMSGVKLAEAEANAALIVALHNSAPAMIAEIRELRAENARLKRDKETLLQFAQAIKTWRSDANSYDRECGHTKRHYCEDVELMEKAAEYAMRRVVARAALGEPQ